MTRGARAGIMAACGSTVADFAYALMAFSADGVAHALAVVTGTFLVADGIGVAGGAIARWVTAPRVLGAINIVVGILIIGFGGSTALG